VVARPGGNITGLSAANDELAAKSFELIREIIPTARRVGVLGNASDPFAKSFLEHIQQAAPMVRRKGLGADSEEKREPVRDIDTAAVDSLKALDPDRPIREATDIARQPNVRFQAVISTGRRNTLSEREKIDYSAIRATANSPLNPIGKYTRVLQQIPPKADQIAA
jgi:ABC transporter substrate binding protein